MINLIKTRSWYVMFSLFPVLSALCSAQEVTREPIAIISKLVDGTQFEIFWGQQYREGGRNVTMQEVVAPILPKIEKDEVELEPRPQLTKEQLAELPEQNQTRMKYFSVSATIYNNRATFVRWWSHKDGQEKMYECWSNVNWNHLGGMVSFRAREQEFTYLLMHGNSSLKALREARRENPEIKVPRIPKELPRLRDSGPRYVMMNGDERDDDAMEFIEAIHDLYAAKQRELRRAYRKRERARLARIEELKRNPPQPKDIEISFWNNNVNK